MIGEIDSEKIQVNSLVRSIKETDKGVDVELILANKEIQRIHAKKVIYAGQKHALKYLLETEKPLFENSYAPWVDITIPNGS